MQAHDHRDARTPPPVTTLRTRDAEVAIYAIAGELRYTVIERSGRVSIHLATEREFVLHFPSLAEHVEAAYAEDTAWLDASFDEAERRAQGPALRAMHGAGAGDGAGDRTSAEPR